jgi:hypothetical protein
MPAVNKRFLFDIHNKRSPQNKNAEGAGLFLLTAASASLNFVTEIHCGGDI